MIAYRHDEERSGVQRIRIVGQSPWNHRPMVKELIRQVGTKLGQSDAVIVFDPSGFNKKIRHSICGCGAAAAWSVGEGGQRSNCGDHGLRLASGTHVSRLQPSPSQRGLRSPQLRTCTTGTASGRLLAGDPAHKSYAFHEYLPSHCHLTCTVRISVQRSASSVMRLTLCACRKHVGRLLPSPLPILRNSGQDAQTASSQ